MGRPPDPHEFFVPDPPGPRNTLNEVGLVGNYALTLTWGDGHHAGIFNWAFLRGLCPCPQCFPGHRGEELQRAARDCLAGRRQ